MTRRHYIITTALILLILIGMGYAGEQDYQESLRQQEHYCQMVKSGRWPDYNGNAATVCKNQTTELPQQRKYQ